MSEHRNGKPAAAVATDLSQIRAVVDHLPQPAWTCRPDGHADYLNRRWVEYTGVPEEEHHGGGWLTAVHPDDRDRTKTAWDAFVAGTAEYDVDYRLRRHDGAYRWFKTRGTLVLDDNGSPVRVFGITTDIDDQKRAEEGLRDSEERLRLAQQVTRIGTFDWNIAENSNHWSPEILALYGLAPEAFAGTYEAWLGRLHPEDAAEAGEEIRRSFETGQYDQDFRIVRPDGSVRWLHARARVLYDAAGRPVRMLGINADVTDRHRANERLREAEERAAFVRRASGVGFWYCDLPFDVLEWDEQVKAHFQLPPDAHVTIDTFYARIHPDDRGPTRAAIERSIAGRTGYDVHYRTVHPATGQEKWVRAIGRTFYAADGTPTRFDGVTLDVTEQRRAEDRSRAILESISDAFFALDRDWNFTYVNKEAERLLARTRDDLVGKCIWAEFPAAVGSDFERCYRRAAAENVAVTFEAIYPPLSTWYEVHVYPSAAGLSVYFRDINERRRAEEVLKMSEALFREMADTAPVTLWLTDPDGACTFLSREWYELTGQTEAEALGLGWTAATHSDDRERAGREFLAANAARGPFRSEYRLRTLDGSYRWVIDSGRPRHGAGGEYLGMVGAVFDIEDRKRAEERFRAFMDHSPAASWVTDTDGRFHFVSATYTGMFALPHSHLVGGSVYDVYAPEFADEYVTNMRAVARSGEPLRTVERAPRPDGSVGEFLVYKFPLPGSDLVGGVAVDVTDQRRAEEALRASEGEARRQLAELHAIYATAPLGFAVFDRDVRYVRVNPVLAAINGVPVEGHLGRPVSEVVPDLADKAAAIHRQVLATDQTVRTEFRGVTKADPATERVWDSFWFPLPGADGAPEAVAIIVQDVTAPRAVEGALRRRERELQTLTDNAPDVIARFDRGHRHVFVSAAVERVTGQPAEAFVGRSNRDLGMPPELCDRWEAAVDAAFARGEPQAVEFWFPSPGGRRFFVSRFVPEFGPDGRVEHVLCVASDQTERKAAEEALADAARSLARERERLAVALRAARLGVYEWRVGEPAVWWSPELYPVYGVDPATFTPTLEAFTALVHPDDRAELWRKTEQCLALKEEFAHEYRVVRPDGAVRWVMNRSTVGLDAAGDPERITGVAADVTERREAEAALRAGEERFRLAASAGRVGVWEWDVVGNAVSWSDSLYPMHGVSKAEFDGTVEGFTALVHPDDRGPVGEAIRRSLAEGAPYGLEFRAVRPDGSVVWLYTQAAVVRDEAGRPRRMLGATVDVTERKRVEEALRDADRRKDEYLATLAHELRNPLAPIRNGLQVMRLAGGSGEAAERARAMMDRQLSHMVRLIDDLLDVSRISRGKLELRRGRLLLSDAVSSAVEAARPAIEAAHHGFEVSIPPDPVYLNADLTRLSQVFSNLLTNSAKYTPGGGRIRLSVERTAGTAVVTVRDSGIGIPAEALPRIFDLFSQVDRSLERSTGGLGIGLALVKGLVEMHGGSVAAESAGPGQGSTFTVTLPLEPAEDATPEPIGRDRDAVRTGPARRVLVVDDNKDSAESMAEMLRLLGHEVRTAHDGVEAVEIAEVFRPEVVVMDVGMPRMNGYDATRRIRERPWGKAVSVVALTGWGQEGDRERSREAGCDGHLVKPVQLAELCTFLSKAPKT